RHGGQPGDLGEDLLEPPHQLQRPLRGLLFLVRMKVAEARQAGDALVDARVVLHRARAQWVEAGVDAERPVGQRREVADELRLRDLRQARQGVAGMNAGAPGACDRFFAGPSDAYCKLLERCLVWKRKLEPGLGQALLRIAREREAGLPHFAETLRSEPGEMDEARECEQRLVRRDVGGCFLPADVLLPSL